MPALLIRRIRSHAVVAVATLLLMLTLVSTGSAPASGPGLTVPKSELRSALVCPIDPTGAHRTPILLVTGTGSDGATAYGFTQGAFEAYGHPVCHVTFPEYATADLQVSVEYLVAGLRRMYRIADRQVAVIGISQGGLLPRFALTYWPDLRRKVSDVIAVSAPQHGAPPRLRLGEILVSTGCSDLAPCKPATWQQERGSNLLAALNAQPDETPGPVSYTTVRSLTDETVRPAGGRRPTAGLDGARNILIQDLCPGRETTHIGTLVDSVTFAALFDAIATKGKGRKGAARPSRLPADVCDKPYAPGLDEATTAAGIEIGPGLSAAQMTSEPKVAAEPKVRRVFRDARSEKQSPAAR